MLHKMSNLSSESSFTDDCHTHNLSPLQNHPYDGRIFDQNMCNQIPYTFIALKDNNDET